MILASVQNGFEEHYMAYLEWWAIIEACDQLEPLIRQIGTFHKRIGA